MNSSKFPMLIGILAVCAIVIAGAAYVVLHNNNGHGSVTDVRGRTIDIPAEVDSVVCIAAGSVRLVEYMGAADLIVGVDAAESKTSSGSLYEATYRIAYDVSSKTVVDQKDPKGIMALKPDVIFWTAEDPSELDALQSSTGIPVVGLNAQGEITVTDDSFAQNIRILGKVLHEEARADQLLDGIASIQKELAEYASKVSQKQNAYIGGMMYFQNGDLFNTSGNYLPFDLGGVKNCMPYEKGVPYKTEAKTIANSGAEYFFVDNANYTKCQTDYRDNKEILSGAPAVSNNSDSDKRVFCLLSYKMYGTNWESELVNAYFIGKTINGDVYDYDLTEKVNAVYALFFPGSGLTLEKVQEKQTHGFGWLDW